MLKIVQDFIAAGRNNRPGTKIKPTSITIHETGNSSKGANARVHAIYIKGDACAARPASWHYTVDSGDTAYQHLPVNEEAYHSGTKLGNTTSIGIEICINSDGNFTIAQKNAQWLAAKLMWEHGLTIKDIKQHYDWSGKGCPATIRGTANGWANFLKGVQEQYEMQRPKPAEEIFYRVVAGSYANKDNAQVMVDKLAKLGVSSFIAVYKKEN